MRGSDDRNEDLSIRADSEISHNGAIREGIDNLNRGLRS